MGRALRGSVQTSEETSSDDPPRRLAALAAARIHAPSDRKWPRQQARCRSTDSMPIPAKLRSATVGRASHVRAARDRPGLPALVAWHQWRSHVSENRDETSMTFFARAPSIRPIRCHSDGLPIVSQLLATRRETDPRTELPVARIADLRTPAPRRKGGLKHADR